MPPFDFAQGKRWSLRIQVLTCFQYDRQKLEKQRALWDCGSSLASSQFAGGSRPGPGHRRTLLGCYRACLAQHPDDRRGATGSGGGLFSPQLYEGQLRGLDQAMRRSTQELLEMRSHRSPSVEAKRKLNKICCRQYLRTLLSHQVELSFS
jgi:hypothetical protein